MANKVKPIQLSHGWGKAADRKLLAAAMLPAIATVITVHRIVREYRSRDRSTDLDRRTIPRIISEQA